MAIEKKYTHFAVLGLGRFGMSIVQTLAAETDANVLACDNNEAKLQQATEYATHVVQVDITDEHALNKLGLGNFDVVILAIGEDFEASLTAAMIAKEHGVKHIIVKAKNNRQKIILKSIGVNEVILPEHEMGLSWPAGCLALILWTFWRNPVPIRLQKCAYGGLAGQNRTPSDIFGASTI
jgi:trk system potassium uptake protein TrkA